MENALVTIDVAWKHTHKDEPIRLVSALDGDRYDVRKLEFFRDGSVGFADETRSSLETALGTVPVPSSTEINADPEFEAQEIALEVFEALWSTPPFVLLFEKPDDTTH